MSSGPSALLSHCVSLLQAHCLPTQPRSHGFQVLLCFPISWVSYSPFQTPALGDWSPLNAAARRSPNPIYWSSCEFLLFNLRPAPCYFFSRRCTVTFPWDLFQTFLVPSKLTTSPTFYRGTFIPFAFWKSQGTQTSIVLPPFSLQFCALLIQSTIVRCTSGSGL